MMRKLTFSLVALTIFIMSANAQNVGIGTSTPIQKLDVIGNMRSSTLSGIGNRLVMADPTGTLNVASGGLLDSIAWKITGNNNIDVTKHFIGTLNAADLIFKTSGNANINERMRISPIGEVVINNYSVGLNTGDVFSVYGTGSNNGSTSNISAVGAFAINGYSSATGSGVYGENVGTGQGVFGNTSNGFGTLGLATGGTGIFGQAGAGTGFAGRFYNTNASGTAILAAGNNLGVTYLVNGSAASFNGSTFGTLSFSNIASAATSGSAVWGNNRKTAIISFLGGAGVTGIDSAFGSGVIGASYFNSGSGVVGLGNSANGAGVNGQAPNGASQVGVYGLAAITGGGTGNTSVGVFGNNTSTGTNAVGVLGQELAAPNGATRYAVFANGDFGGSGGKYFIIDHPLDPANKFLKHACMESNEVLNFYRGNVILDANGEAIVQLPAYFNSINNNNYNYNLTAIGAAASLFVKSEVNNNQFVIAGGQPGMKVSWTLTAERNDPYFQLNPDKRLVEIPKTGDAAGKYLQPGLFGQPETMGIYYKNIPAKVEVTEKSATVERPDLTKVKQLRNQ